MIIAFLVMLNPFALFLYLQPIMKDLSDRDFTWVLTKASFISFVIFFIASLAGELFFTKVLQIPLDSFRIFGGITIFAVSFIYVVRGEAALVHMKEDLDEVASEIALPFMVGAGTISLSILIGHNATPLQSALMLAFIMVITAACILVLKNMRHGLRNNRVRVAFDKIMNMFLRLSAFFVGSIGVNMIITGINNLYF